MVISVFKKDAARLVTFFICVKERVRLCLQLVGDNAAKWSDLLLCIHAHHRVGLEDRNAVLVIVIADGGVGAVAAVFSFM